MKKLLLLFLSILLSIPTLKAQKIIINRVNVIPMDEETVLRTRAVWVEGDHITKITDAVDPETIDESFTVLDMGGKYIIPGLAEMHGHIPPTNPPPNFPSYFNDDYVESTLFLYVAAGITTVRGMLGYENQLSLKDKVLTGELTGPTLYLAGPSFNGNSVSSPGQAREMVQQHFDEGWDLLKVHPGLTKPEFDAMADKANEVGIDFGGHVPTDVGIMHALEKGIKTVDHMDGYAAYVESFPESERNAAALRLAQKTKEMDAYIVPTMALWETILGAADLCFDENL